MNLKDLVSYLSEFWARHSPTVVSHIALAVVFAGYLLTPATTTEAANLWQTAKASIDSIGAEFGVQLERWVVLAAAAYVYLTSFQWLAGIAGSLPGLQVYSTSTPEPYLVARLARFLKLDLSGRDFENQVWQRWNEVHKARYESSGQSGLSWYNQRISLWTRYLGVSAVALAAILVWWLYGANGAVSQDRVRNVAGALLLFVGIARFRLHYWSRQRDHIATLKAVEAYEQKNSEVRESSDLIALRERRITHVISHHLQVARHPTYIVGTLVWRLPVPYALRRWLSSWLPHRSRQWRGEDWILHESFLRFHPAEDGEVPHALSVEPFRTRFRSLMECRGAGLCLLVSRESGLAPAAERFGTAYCFAERRHGGRLFGVWFSGYRREGSIGSLHFGNAYRGSFSVFVDLGAYPIELASQHDFPRDRDPDESDRVDWSVLLRPLAADQVRGATTIGGAPVQTSIDVRPGHTYLLHAKSGDDGPEAVVVLQCFELREDGRLLIAWKLLNVLSNPSSPPKVATWWSASGWREFYADLHEHLARRSEREHADRM